MAELFIGATVLFQGRQGVITGELPANHWTVEFRVVAGEGPTLRIENESHTIAGANLKRA